MTPAGRLHQAARLVELALARYTLHPDQPPDTHAVYRHARTIHDTIARWAFTPTRPDAGHLEQNRTHADDWCKHCLSTGGWCVPVHRAGLCDWCYTFRLRQHRGLPVKALLQIHHDRGHVTQQLIDRHQPPNKKART